MSNFIWILCDAVDQGSAIVSTLTADLDSASSRAGDPCTIRVSERGERLIPRWIPTSPDTHSFHEPVGNSDKNMLT